MLRTLSRIFVILIVAGILAGGVYAFSTTNLTGSTDPTSFESRSEPAVDGPDAALNTDSDSVAPVDERDFERRPPEDLPVWVRFSGILGHLAVIGGIIIAVTYVQKLITWISVKPKARISHQRI